MRLTATYLREINNERIHVQAIQETGETLSKPAEALVHELKMHQVRLEVRHRVAEFGELGLEGIERRRSGEGVVL